MYVFLATSIVRVPGPALGAPESVAADPLPGVLGFRISEGASHDLVNLSLPDEASHVVRILTQASPHVFPALRPLPRPGLLRDLCLGTAPYGIFPVEVAEVFERGHPLRSPIDLYSQEGGLQLRGRSDISHTGAIATPPLPLALLQELFFWTRDDADLTEAFLDLSRHWPERAIEILERRGSAGWGAHPLTRTLTLEREHLDRIADCLPADLVERGRLACDDFESGRQEQVAVPPYHALDDLQSTDDATPSAPSSPEDPEAWLIDPDQP